MYKNSIYLKSQSQKMLKNNCLISEIRSHKNELNVSPGSLLIYQLIK